MKLSQYFQNKKKNLTESNNKIFKITIITVALIYGTFFRLYGLPNQSEFQGDEGRDLLIANHLVDTRSNPKIGPPLSIGVYSPPSYYQLLKIFYRLSPKPENIVLFFTLMNFIGIGLIYFLTNIEYGSKVSLISLILSSISNEIIITSRNIWQPWPLFLFTSLSIFLLYISIKRKNLTILIFSIVMYFFTTSIHPSALLLIFFFYYNSYKIIKTKYKHPIFLTSLLFVVIFLLFFLPTILFNLSQNNFALYIFNQASNQTHIKKLLIAIPTLLSVIIIKFNSSYNSIVNKTISFSPLLLTVITVLLCSGELHSHYLIALLPFFIIIGSLVINKLLLSKKLHVTLPLSLLGVYLVFLNHQNNLRLISNPSSLTFSRAKWLANSIEKQYSISEICDLKINILTYPDHHAYPIYFFLNQNSDCLLKFDPIDLSPKIHPISTTGKKTIIIKNGVQKSF